MPRTRPPYPEEFRREAIELVRISSKSQHQIAEDLALHPQRLIFTTQPVKLLTLIARQAIRALALIPLGLLNPNSSA